MSLMSIFRSPGPTGFGYSSTAEDVTQGSRSKEDDPHHGV